MEGKSATGPSSELSWRTGDDDGIGVGGMGGGRAWAHSALGLEASEVVVGRRSVLLSRAAHTAQRSAGIGQCCRAHGSTIMGVRLTSIDESCVLREDRVFS